MALTAIFGALQSTIITSHSLNLLIEPIPSTPSPSALQLITNVTNNLSTSTFAHTYFSCPLDNLWNLDTRPDETGVFREDRRSIDTLPMTNKGSDDLQTLTPGLQNDSEVSHSPSTGMISSSFSSQVTFCPLVILGVPLPLPIFSSHPNILEVAITIDDPKTSVSFIFVCHSMSLTRHSRRLYWNPHQSTSLMR